MATLKSGDLVEVELEIDSKNDYEYLIFEDMKAAGFEPVEVRSGYNGNDLGAYIEFRDDRVALLRRGRWPAASTASRYRLRAEIPGTFRALPTRAQAMYAPELKGELGRDQAQGRGSGGGRLMVRSFCAGKFPLSCVITFSVIALPGPLLAQEAEGATRAGAERPRAQVIAIFDVDGRRLQELLARCRACVASARRHEDAMRRTTRKRNASPAPDQTISDSVFAHWVFGMEDVRDARRRLKEMLGTRVDEVESTYRITQAQKRKLELAGKGDIERFFDHVAEKRKELDLLQVNENKTRRFVLTELIPLRGKMRQGPFGEGSLFAKTMNKMLNEKQLMRKT